jgi:arginyl-tRNA synthetase
MKQHIEQLIHTALLQLQESGVLHTVPAFIQIDPVKDKQHGDFASNIAMVLAKQAKTKPREMAELIIKQLPASSYLQKVEAAGPGFINFYLTSQALAETVPLILKMKHDYGRSQLGRNKRILVEFVSSNPTGPLHVGHGRHAAFGAVVCNLLQTAGFDVYREYYLNDAGRQVDILTVSIWLRYLSLLNESIIFPANGYQGDYVIHIAGLLHEQHASFFYAAQQDIFKELPLDEAQGGDKEIYIDALILRAKQLLGQRYQLIFDFGVDYIAADMRDDLTEFGVHFDHWFSEKHFLLTPAVQQFLQRLKESGHTYEHEGALWFRAKDFGDEKDRVLIRSNGQHTYFLNDAAYHLNKFERGFDIAIDIFGSDHHGYMARTKAAVEACGINPERLLHLLVRFVSLYRGGQPVQMSTRGGKFVTLRELRNEVGNDAARFFYVMRKSEQPMDFDLDLAKSQSNENPVYYVQYAYARICSIFKQLSERHLTFNETESFQHVHLLKEKHERELLNTIARYPDVIASAALNYEPHQLTNYLRELASHFHTYYNSHQFIVDDVALRHARLALITAVKQVLLNGFELLGISAPKSM